MVGLLKQLRAARRVQNIRRKTSLSRQNNSEIDTKVGLSINGTKVAPSQGTSAASFKGTSAAS
jgi:hypothetical protein